MDPVTAQKLQKAETMRQKPHWLMSLFSGPDYLGSAELFIELAEAANTPATRAQFLAEAAATFTQEGGEYGLFRAAETYRALATAHKEGGSRDATLAAMEAEAQSLLRCRKFLMAGQAYVRRAEMWPNERSAEAIEDYKQAAAAIDRDGACPYNKKDVQRRCLRLQLESNDLAGAIEMLGVLDIEYGPLCRQMLCLITSTEADIDLDDSAQQALCSAIINRSGEDAVQAIDNFVKDTYLPDYASRVFEIVRTQLLPENDIC